MKRLILLVLTGAAMSCGSSEASSTDAGVAAVDSGPADTGATPDAGTVSQDSGVLADAGMVMDAGMMMDAGAQTPDAGLPTDTWTNGTSTLFQTYCVECHGAGSGSRDYTTYADPFRDRAKIRCGVAPRGERPSGCSGFPGPGQFPVGNGPSPSNDERRRIVQWVEAGAIE